MKNKVQDMVDFMFLQLDRINNEELSDEKLELEIKRTDAMVSIAEQINLATKNTIDAAKLITQGNAAKEDLYIITGAKRQLSNGNNG